MFTYYVQCPVCSDRIGEESREDAQAFLIMHRLLHVLGASRREITQAMFAHAEAIRS